MAHGIYICSAEGNTGKSTIALGAVETLTHRASRVGVFRPITRSSKERDYVLDLLLAHEGVVDLPYEDAIGVGYDEVHVDPDAALEKIVQRFKAIEGRCDAIVVIGSDYTDVGSPTELAFNARVAANLGTPVLLVLGGRVAEWQGRSEALGRTAARTAPELAQLTELATEELAREHATVLGIVVNRADPDALDDIIERVAAVATWSGSWALEQPKVAASVPVWAIPEDRYLVAPSMRTIMEAVDGDLYVGDADLLDREAMGVVVAAMSLENVLARLDEGDVVIVPSDRAEITLGVLTAHESANFPSLSGIVLNGGFPLGEQVERLVVGLKAGLPVIRTELSSYAAALAITETRGRLAVESQRKQDTALALFERHIDADAILDLLEVASPEIVTPLMFEYGLLERARADRKRIVLTEGDDDRTLRAAATLLARDVADLVILGEEIEVRGRALGLGLDISRAQIVSNEDYVEVFRLADVYQRKVGAGATPEEARDTVRDPVYFAALTVDAGGADGLVTGLSHSTAHGFQPGLELTEPDRPLASVHVLALSDIAMVYVDAALQGRSTPDELARIAIASARSASRVGIEPRIAMLAQPGGGRVDLVARAVAAAREAAPELVIDGPLSYDEAVAARSTVRVFVDPNAATSAADAMAHSAGALVIGPVLQGASLTISDLPRDAAVRDVVNAVALTAILSGE